MAAKFGRELKSHEPKHQGEHGDGNFATGLQSKHPSQSSLSSASLGGSDAGDDPFNELSFERGGGMSDSKESASRSLSHFETPNSVNAGDSKIAWRALLNEEMEAENLSADLAAANLTPIQSTHLGATTPSAKETTTNDSASSTLSRGAGAEGIPGKKARDSVIMEAELWEATVRQATAAGSDTQERYVRGTQDNQAATAIQGAERHQATEVASASVGVPLDEDEGNSGTSAGEEEIDMDGAQQLRGPAPPMDKPIESTATAKPETKKNRARTIARKPSRRDTPEYATETTVQLCRRLLAAQKSGEALFEGMLPKKRVELSRYYKSGWKGRFLKVYYDKIEYGKWNKWGRYVLRKGSPIFVDHNFSVLAEGGSGTDAPTPASPPGPRFFVLRAKKADGSLEGTQVATHVFLDDPTDKKKKGLKLLKTLQDIVLCQRRLFMERTVFKYLSDAVAREHRRDLNKWAREAKPLLEDGGIEGLLTPELSELLIHAVGLVETIYVAQEAWRAKLEDILELLLNDATPGIGDGQSLDKFSAAYRLATEGVEMNGDVINLSHEAFDDLMVSASARLARLRAEKAAADAFANGLLVDCRAPLEAAAAACEELRNQGPLPESLELSATAAKARIVAMSVAQAKKRAEYEAALVAALEGEAWEPARDALAQATEGVTMHGDHVSLAKKPELLAAGARRVARLADEESLTAQCVAAKISDTREALSSAVKACDDLAAQEFSASAAAFKTSKSGSKSKEGKSSSSSSSRKENDTLPPYLRQHRTHLAERLQAVESAQQEWLAKAEAQVRELCAHDGGDLKALRAAEDDLAVDSIGIGRRNGDNSGNENGSGSFNNNSSISTDKGNYSITLHGDLLTLRGRRGLIDLVHKRLGRLIQEDNLAQKLEDATESGDVDAMKLCVAAARKLAEQGQEPLTTEFSEQVNDCEAQLAELAAALEVEAAAAAAKAKEEEEEAQAAEALVVAAARKAELMRKKSIALAEAAAKEAQEEEEARALEAQAEKEAQEKKKAKMWAEQAMKEAAAAEESIARIEGKARKAREDMEGKAQSPPPQAETNAETKTKPVAPDEQVRNEDEGGEETAQLAQAEKEAKAKKEAEAKAALAEKEAKAKKEAEAKAAQAEKEAKAKKVEKAASNVDTNPSSQASLDLDDPNDLVETVNPQATAKKTDAPPKPKPKQPIKKQDSSTFGSSMFNLPSSSGGVFDVLSGSPSKSTAASAASQGQGDGGGPGLSMSDLFEKLDADGDGTLTRAEVVAGADLLGITPAEAGQLFDDLDEDGSGTLSQQEASGFGSWLLTGAASSVTTFASGAFGALGGGTQI